MKADIQKQGGGLALALCLIAVFSLSALFVVSHADHDCTGTDCAVCHEIHSCLSALRHISEGWGPLPIMDWARCSCCSALCCLCPCRTGVPVP